MKTLGVIGGLGPMATAYFMQLIIEMTDATKDQEHIPIIVFNMPQIPDRTKFLLHQSEESPIPVIVDIEKKLQGLGADMIAIPCITAHAMHEKLQNEIEIPIIHAIRETVQYLKKQNVKCVGLEATDGTIETQVFQTELEKENIKVIVPTHENQRIIMEIIYEQVKASKPVKMTEFLQVEKQLKEDGAEVILLGCTELSMIKRDYKVNPGYLDVLEVLASKVVGECSKLKDEYQCLITGQI